MPDIDISHPHTLGLPDGRAAVEQVAQALEEDLGVDYEWSGNTLEFDGQGADGHIEVESDVVHVSIDLPMFLKPMRGRIRDEAKSYLERYL